LIRPKPRTKFLHTVHARRHGGTSDMLRGGPPFVTSTSHDGTAFCKFTCAFIGTVIESSSRRMASCRTARIFSSSLALHRYLSFRSAVTVTMSSGIDIERPELRPTQTTSNSESCLYRDSPATCSDRAFVPVRIGLDGQDGILRREIACANPQPAPSIHEPSLCPPHTGSDGLLTNAPNPTTRLPVFQRRRTRA